MQIPPLHRLRMKTSTGPTRRPTVLGAPAPRRFCGRSTRLDRGRATGAPRDLPGPSRTNPSPGVTAATQSPALVAASLCPRSPSSISWAGRRSMREPSTGRHRCSPSPGSSSALRTSTSRWWPGSVRSIRRGVPGACGSEAGLTQKGWLAVLEGTTSGPYSPASRRAAAPSPEVSNAREPEPVRSTDDFPRFCARLCQLFSHGCRLRLGTTLNSSVPRECCGDGRLRHGRPSYGSCRVKPTKPILPLVNKVVATVGSQAYNEKGG